MFVYVSATDKPIVYLSPNSCIKDQLLKGNKIVSNGSSWPNLEFKNSEDETILFHCVKVRE